MPDSPLRFENAGGLARLTLNKPAAGNVLDMDMLRALSVAATRLHDEMPRAVLIMAEGKNFCVGGDIRVFAKAPDRRTMLKQMAGVLHEAVARLASLPAPVVVAVQGAAAGAGLSLAAGADLLVAARSASFSMAYPGIGFSCDGGGSYYLPRLIGLRRAQELAYTDRRLTAEEALSWGLVTSIADDSSLVSEAEALALRLAAGPTRAYGAFKALLARDISLQEHLDTELENIAETAASRDGIEGVAAFIDRRKPVFTGE